LEVLASVTTWNEDHTLLGTDAHVLMFRMGADLRKRLNPESFQLQNFDVLFCRIIIAKVE
jgi:hypothetical protein